MARALESLGLRVFREPEDLVDELDRLTAPALEQSAALKEVANQSSATLTTALSQALTAFREHERKVLGFIAYFGSPSKNELFDLLSRSGMPREIAENVVARLALAGVVQDTGNHYLVPDKRLAQLAIDSVENDIINLLSGDSPNGL